MATEPAALRAFLNLAVVPIFLMAAWSFAAGRPRNAAAWLMAVFLGLLGVRTAAGGLVDVVGAGTPEGAAWSLTFFDLNLAAFTLFLAFVALFPAPMRARSLGGALWIALVAAQVLLDAGWLLHRSWYLVEGQPTLAYQVMSQLVTTLVTASIVVVAWRARKLAPRERNGAVLVVVSAAVSVFNASGGQLVGLARGGSLGATDLATVALALAASLFFALRWRLWLPLAVMAFGAFIAAARVAAQLDFSTFALVLALRALAPVHVAQRTGLFALERPPRWLARATAFTALACCFAMVNVIAIVVFQGHPLAVAIGVFLGLVVGGLAAYAALPPGARLRPARDEGLLLGRYRFVRALGEGGQGRAQVHVDERLQREVVLKRVPGGEEGPAMREARALARVRHENVVRVYDADVHAGEGVIVMEHVAGGSLAGLLARSGGRLPPREALRIADEMLAALAACHDAGVVHGDVKPENVLLTREGAVRLADFGNARHVSDVTLMPGGGTLRYMSPEQLRGQPPDARTDLYATGVVLHEMLSGAWHLGEAPVEPAFLTVRTLTGDLALALPASADPLRPALEKALARDPAHRFADAREMAAALRALTPPAA